MTGVEVTLIIIGVIFLLGSFFLQDKISTKDIYVIKDYIGNGAINSPQK